MTAEREGAASHVAVVIAAYEAERFVAEALETVLEQALPATEVVVVDDGSEDATARVVEGYGRRGVRLVSQPNQGPAAARNRGVAETTAPLIAFLDADDRWPADHLARSLAALADDPGVAGVVGEVECFASPASGAAAGGWPAVPIGRQPGWLPGALVMRRTAWEGVGPFDASLRSGGEFIDWVARVRMLGLRIEAREGLALYRRVHPDSLTARARPALEAAYVDVIKAAHVRRRTRS